MLRTAQLACWFIKWSSLSHLFGISEHRERADGRAKLGRD